MSTALQHSYEGFLWGSQYIKRAISLHIVNVSTPINEYGDFAVYVKWLMTGPIFDIWGYAKIYDNARLWSIRICNYWIPYSIHPSKIKISFEKNWTPKLYSLIVIFTKCMQGNDKRKHCDERTKGVSRLICPLYCFFPGGMGKHVPIPLWPCERWKHLHWRILQLAPQ